MRRERKKNKIIIFILIGIVCMMGVGYAAFQTQLDIKGNTEISSEWNIKIISAEVSDTGGSGENVKNTYTDLTANLEANLYSKGDYVEYNVIVENAGTFDAKLDTLGITNSNNEAVKITRTGLVKGQSLYKGETATLTVRIEYNSNYEGDASGTSGETTIDLGFVQNSEGTIEPTVDHLVTYDYTTNGGESTTAENEYVAEGENINLSYTATKTNYEFKGWNTNAQASEGLTDLTMGTEDITLYAIFEAIDTTPPVIESINTSSTTNSITAVVIASDEESRISKYEFSIDGGKTWIDNGVSNTYTFTGLKQGTSYDINVRVTNGVDMSSSSNTKETTLTIEKPIFEEKSEAEVTITYPEGCSSTYTCSYIEDNGKEILVTNNTVDVVLDAGGVLIAKVSDGTNEVSSTYTIIRYNLYVSSSGSDTTGYGTIEKPYATITKAYNSANVSDSTIYVMDDITVNDVIDLNENKNLTITSYSTNDTINSVIKGKKLNSSMLKLSSGEITLKDITIDGNNIDDTSSGIWLYNTSILNLNSNATVQNFKSEIGGGGVRLANENDVNNTTLNINGGKVINNTSETSGGGIVSDSGGTVNMTAGEISNNKALNDGGLGLYSSTFKMTGGSIIDNTAEHHGGGIALGNSNESIETVVTISGGTIQNNSANDLLYKDIDFYKGYLVDVKGNYVANSKAINKVASAIDNTYVLDVDSGNAANNTNVQIYQSNDSNAQRWKIIPAKVIDGIVYYRYQSQVDGTQYLDVTKSGTTSGTNIQTYEIVETPSGFFSLARYSDGNYQIKNINDLCVDVQGGSVANKKNVQAYTCNDTTAQKWRLEVMNASNITGENYTLIPGLVKGGSLDLSKNGNNIKILAQPNKNFEYQGATVVCDNDSTYDVKGNSFDVPNCTGNIYVYPTWKRDDYYVWSEDNKNYRDEFGHTQYTTGDARPTFTKETNYYSIMTTTTGNFRGQYSSTDTYTVDDFETLNLDYSGTYTSGTGDYTMSFGMITSQSNWLNNNYSFQVNETFKYPNIFTSPRTLTIKFNNQYTNKNKYYISWQYLTHGLVSKAIANNIWFTGATFSYTNTGY